jgi:multiple sugar transport system permease protein
MANLFSQSNSQGTKTMKLEKSTVTAGQADKRHHRSLLDLLDATFQYWALAPAVLLLTFLTLYPMVNVFRMSVSKIDFMRGEFIWTFTGLQNWQTLAEDWLFRTALGNTLIFVGATVIIEMVLGLALALLASQISFGKGIYRTIMVLPILVPGVAIGCMWRLMYNFDFGVFNQALTALNLPPQSWLADPKLAMPSVILVDIWHWVPFVFLILLAGLEAMPVEVLEAANVDGANGWQRLWHIILPLISSTLSVALMFRTIFAFKVFDEIFLLTNGGPGTATQVVSLYIYRVFFRENQLGYGAALSVLVILVISVFVVAYRNLKLGEEK